MRFKDILYNNKYSQGSLYGLGIFPFWLYVKYFGKPVYKSCRHLGFNKYFSMMGANILGSLFHVSFFIDPAWWTPIWFVISLVLFTWLFYGIHLTTIKTRKRMMELNKLRREFNEKHGEFMKKHGLQD